MAALEEGEMMTRKSDDMPRAEKTREELSSQELIELVREADRAEERAKLRATVILSSSVVVAAVAAGMLAHENALVSALVFVGVCLASVRFMLKYFA